MHLRAAAMAALCLSAAWGCSSQRASAPTTPGAASTIATTAAVPASTAGGSSGSAAGTTPASEAEPAPVASSVPRGATIITSSSAGVTFAVPETYTVLDPSELGDDFFAGPAFEELAFRTGLSTDEFEQLLKEAVELYVFAPATAQGFVDNVTVAMVANDALPTPDVLEQTLAALGAEDFETTVDTVRGIDYVRSAYTLPIDGAPVYGVDIQVLVNGAPVEITATASTKDIAAQLGTLILDTVAVA